VFAVAAAEGFSARPLERLDDQPLELVDRSDLIAITAPIDIGRQGATGEMKRRHDRLLEALMRETPHVPLQHGVMFSGHQGVSSFLDDHHRDFHAELERLGRAHESLLRLTWAIEERGAHLADKYDELADLRAEADESGGADMPALSERFSRRFDEVLETERRNYREVLERRLVPECREVRRLETAGDDELMRLRCLIDDDSYDQFEASLYDLAEDLGEATVFELTSPAPPVSFLDDQLVF
jgi:hypothetical protein